MKITISLFGVLLVAIVIGAVFDIDVYPFGGSNKKTEESYLRELQKSGTASELADIVAKQVAQQESKWLNRKDGRRLDI